MVFCSVFKIIQRNDTNFFICDYSQTPIFFNFGFFKARIPKNYQSETIYFAQRDKKRKHLSDSKNVKNDEKHQKLVQDQPLGLYPSPSPCPPTLHHGL